MGRKPKPLRLHLAQGTLRPHRAKISPQAGGELVKPSDLKGEAAKVWDRVVDFCTTAGGGECDIESLAGMCRWYAEFRKCWTCMEQMQITDEKYRRVQMCVANAWRCFVDMASRFGLSPADRTKLSEQPEAQLSALDQMMDRRS